MTKKEIYDAEQQNFDKIILHKEGLFWIAYERSAYRVFHDIKRFKPNKKYIKIVGAEVVSLGFPDKGANPMVGLRIVSTGDRIVAYEAKNRSLSREDMEAKFAAWKESVGGGEAPKVRPKAVQYDNLPVYKAIYDLTLQVYKQSQHMKRDFRYTLGEKIKTEMVELLTAVSSANESAEKGAYIDEARRLIQVIRIQMRLLHDLQQVNVTQMAEFNLGLNGISTQLAAWQKAAARKY